MPDERHTFETARIRLEEIAAEVRKKDTSLEKSLDLLEEGVRLANICTELVDHTDLSATVTATVPDAAPEQAGGEAAATEQADEESADGEPADAVVSAEDAESSDADASDDAGPDDGASAPADTDQTPDFDAADDDLHEPDGAREAD